MTQAPNEADRLSAAAERFVAPFSADPRCEAILLTGSVALGRADAISDVDLSVYWRMLPPEAEMEALKARAIASGGGIYSYSPEEELACYTFFEGIKIDTGHAQTAQIATLVAEFATAPSTSEAVPQIIGSGILQGRALHGAEVIGAWQEQLHNLPASYWPALIRDHLRFAPREILQRMGAQRGDYPLIYEIFVDQVKNLLNIWCGLNQRIPPGKIKGMEATVATLTRVPERAAQRCRHLWVLPPDEAVASFYELIEETLGLIAADYPEIDTAPLRARLAIPLRHAVALGA